VAFAAAVGSEVEVLVEVAPTVVLDGLADGLFEVPDALVVIADS
jgi:hypothetical protein